MKCCNRCGEAKPLSAFHKHANCADGHLNQCRVCRNKYVSEYRMKRGGGNAIRGIGKAARLAKTARRRKRIREYIDAAKAAPCADCGKSYPPVCMDFDHVRGEKKFDIAASGSRAGSWQSLKTEIAKCELVCANCHRLRTESRRAS